MKSKIALLLGCLVIGTTSVNAMTLKEDGTYINKKNVSISAKVYNKLSEKFNDGTIDLFDQKRMDFFTKNIDKISQDTKYIVTTEVLDNKGNIIETRELEVSKEEALNVASNKNIFVTSDKALFDKSNICDAKTVTSNDDQWIYSTASKQVRLSYSAFDEGYIAIIDAKWFTQPTIKQYDVLAIRWNNSKALSNVTGGEGYQSTSNGYSQDYHLDDSNCKRTTYGIGESMNLFNNGRDFELGMMYDFNSSVGEYMYGTYQHARNSNANTLAISKSYSFSSSGLGGVLYFSNSTYRNYYDGMTGVVDTLSSGSHFIW